MIAAAAALATAAFQRSNEYIIDATCCLEGNPLAHMLDYRAVKLGSSGKLA
jgi:hypothetical protein